MTHNAFLGFLARSRHVLSFPFSFAITLWSAGMILPDTFVSFFFIFLLQLGLVFWLVLSDFSFKIPEDFVGHIFLHSFLYMYHLSIWSNFCGFHNSQWLTFTFTIPAFVLFLCYFIVCAYYVVYWYLSFSIYLHDLHLLFSSVLFIISTRFGITYTKIIYHRYYHHHHLETTCPTDYDLIS